jgi:hypothetical protein
LTPSPITHPPTPQHWNTLQVNVFLETLLEHVDATAPLCDAALLSLDTKYGFSHTANSEIQFRWYSLCLRSSAAWIVPQVSLICDPRLYAKLHQSAV